MLDLAILDKKLEPGASLGVDTLDPRFQDTAALVEQGAFAQAAEKCRETFDEGLYDIRLISWYFLAVFLQDGVAALVPIFRVGTGLLKDSWAAVGPEKKKENHAVAGLAWFSSKAADRLAAVEADKGDEWKKWLEAAAQAQAMLDGANGLLEAVNSVLAAAPNVQKATDPLGRVRDWIASFQAQTAEPEPEPAPVEATPEAEAPTEAPAGGAPSLAAPGVAGVEGSFRLQELQARIAAFDALMKRGEVAKAALIASDLVHTIEHFDPRLYFPKLFAGFYVHFAAKADGLAGWWDKKGSLAWTVLDQLYRTDLDAYLASREKDVQGLLSGAASGGGNGTEPPPAPEPEPEPETRPAARKREPEPPKNEPEPAASAVDELY